MENGSARPQTPIAVAQSARMDEGAFTRWVGLSLACVCAIMLALNALAFG